MKPTSTLSGGQVAGLIRQFNKLRIAVIGDVMLDEYIVGDVERTSPEAPVPLVRIEEESHRLGGAAHVANLAATLGARVYLWGRVGGDHTGDRLLAKCKEAGIHSTHVDQAADRLTTRKVRVLSQNRQVLRLDWEQARRSDEGPPADPAETLRAEGPFDAVIISDYAKGYLAKESIARVIAVCKEWGTPVLVDPKSQDLTRYRGATIIKPNRKEFEAACGRRLGDDLAAEITELGVKTLEATEAEYLIVTLSEHGMAIVTRDAAPVFYESTAREVFDISGAGDTVIAVLALARATGADFDAAIQLANAAAGIVVDRSGVAVITPAELAAPFGPRPNHNVLSLDELLDRVAWWRLRDKKVVFTNGCFDLLHIGHVSLLKQAAEEGDVLVVAINSDESVRRLKGDSRPVLGQQDRATVLAALDCVDAVVVFDEDTPLELLQQIRPDVLAKGADYKREQVVGHELIEEHGGKVVSIPLISGKSTTLLVERMQAAGLRTPDGD